MPSFSSAGRDRHAHDGNTLSAEDIVAYDTETSDADPKHGQVLQFGAVTAYADLSPKAEHALRVRRLPYIVPTPEAMAITGIPYEALDDPSLPDEFDAARMMHKVLKVPFDTFRLFITHNGIAFDDGILKSTFFRQLLDPYFNAGKAAARLDTMLMSQAAAAASVESLVVPRNEDDKPSFKLEALCKANGISIEAHDALEDARATLKLAGVIKAAAPWLWQAAVAAGNAARVDHRLQLAAQDRTVVWHFEHFGAPDLAPCLVLGSNGKRGWLLADLRKDLSAITDGDIPDLDDVGARKEGGLRIIRSNAAPLFFDEPDARRFGPLMSQTEAEGIAGSLTLPATLLERFVDRSFPQREGATSEERIYDGFVSNLDKSRMAKFATEPSWDARAAIVFDDPRIADFAARILAASAPQRDLFGSPTTSAGAKIEEASRHAMTRPFAGPEAPWATLGSCYPTADENWRAWARSAFNYDPAPAYRG